MRESPLYIITKPIVNLYVKIMLRPKYIGLENLPKSGKIILAGTHTNSLDAILLMSSYERPIHFLAKKELFEFPYSIIFSHMGLIPVDRSRKCPESLETARKYLKDNKVVLIFPEGTLEKVKGKSLPFKMGAVKLAYDTGAKIVPFAIRGTYYKKDLQIAFGKPMSVRDDLKYSLKLLKREVEKLRK